MPDSGVQVTYDIEYIELPTHQSGVMTGSPGCGKTTQVTLFVLDELDRTTACRIVVTKPRRLAAMCAAMRVSQERGWVLGTVKSKEDISSYRPIPLDLVQSF